MTQLAFIQTIMWHTEVWPIAALAGPLAFLYLRLLLESAVATVDQWQYLKRHARALAFSGGSLGRNLLYGWCHRDRSVADLKALGAAKPGHGHGRVVILIPGTWSGKGYRWQRWDAYCNRLQADGYAVYGLRWHATNSQAMRLEVAGYICAWLEEQGFAEGAVDLVGHSFGGHVASLASSHPAVRKVVTVAAPFVVVRELDQNEIAGSLIAIFTRFFALVITSYLAFKVAAHALMPEQASLLHGAVTVVCGFSALAVGLAFIVPIIRKLMLAHARSGQLDSPGISCDLTPIRIHQDEVLDEMVDASSSAYSAPMPSPQFLDQSAIHPGAFWAWFVPFVASAGAFQCAYFWLGTLGFRTGLEQLHFFDAGLVLAPLYFAIYILLTRMRAGHSARASLRYQWVLGFCNLVDRKAVIAHNRRRVVAWLAGVEGGQLLLQHIQIVACPDPQKGVQWMGLQADGPSSASCKRGLFASRHSKGLEDPLVVDEVLNCLGCAEISP